MSQSETELTATPPTSPHRLVVIVLALGLTQLFSWGPLYYSMAVLWPAIGDALQMSRTALFAVVSMALLVNGLVAARIGRLIDQQGGRGVMAIGSVVAAIGMALIASATHPLIFVLGWVLGGVSMAMIFYDPAFATLSQHSGNQHRRALTAVTLIGGLASTVYWPVTESLLAAVGWRGAFWVFAATQLLVCLPLHWFTIPKRKPPHPMCDVSDVSDASTASTADDSIGKESENPQALRVFRWFAIAFALHAFLMSALAINLLGMLQSRGLSLSDAVLVGMLMGPLQVAGRLVDLLLGRWISARVLGTGAFAAVMVSMVLFLQQTLDVFAACVLVAIYGAGNGLITIAKGMNVADLFGREHYGYWLGRLSRWVYGMYAVAPLAFGLILAAGIGYQRTSWLMLLFAVAALICYEKAMRIHAANTVAQ